MDSFPSSGPGIGFPGDIMFTIVPVFIGIVFVIVIGTIIFRAAKGAKQWNYNNQQPVLTVDATVISKRTDVSRHHHNHDNHHHHRTSTYYYVTFEVGSGDRMEFQVDGKEFGLLAEGDYGNLTFQGTRYQGFQRFAYEENN
ncbi:DUF2500 domain-containing protein [Bacillaceae bacterium S4-13-58]